MTQRVQQPLDEQTIATIKSTVPVLKEHGETITSHFYKQLFENHPELKNVFNQTHQKAGEQPRALANTVYAAALHIDNLGAILPRVKQIAEKHRSLNVQSEHYPIVGEHLLGAIKEVLGDAATDDIIDAWGKAYGVIADAFIQVEKNLYKETADQEGGWVGYRDFKVVQKKEESEEITSFYLKPCDEGAVPYFKPGQYLTVKAEIDGEPHDHLRQYSLSDAPGQDYFRISVKKEREGRGPAGIVSNWLHRNVSEGDVLPISAPAGDFYLNDTERPVVFLSGGVGLTPLMSMWKTMKQYSDERQAFFIHAARNGRVHALKDEMKAEEANFNTTVFYEQPGPEDRSYDQEGRIDFGWLEHYVPREADFYFCGPEGFMKAVVKSLREWDIPEDRLHYEFFGTQAQL
ncbi:NO-inducible flavohemoprotein [Halobacillus salinus]|uniref:NO-inducible flavohemoprotein n=1 Tax=Halobacillus salinus TaxID=192814 RepID=UPI0009A5DF5F|nr:NO-inducible flavohemoprotein [Halobacillus salinus]